MSLLLQIHNHVCYQPNICDDKGMFPHFILHIYQIDKAGGGGGGEVFMHNKTLFGCLWMM